MRPCSTSSPPWRKAPSGDALRASRAGLLCCTARVTCLVMQPAGARPCAAPPHPAPLWLGKALAPTSHASGSAQAQHLEGLIPMHRIKATQQKLVSLHLKPVSKWHITAPSTSLCVHCAKPPSHMRSSERHRLEAPDPFAGRRLRPWPPFCTSPSPSCLSSTAAPAPRTAMPTCTVSSRTSASCCTTPSSSSAPRSRWWRCWRTSWVSGAPGQAVRECNVPS